MKRRDALKNVLRGVAAVAVGAGLDLKLKEPEPDYRYQRIYTDVAGTCKSIGFEFDGQNYFMHALGRENVND